MSAFDVADSQLPSLAEGSGGMAALETGSDELAKPAAPRRKRAQPRPAATATAEETAAPSPQRGLKRNPSSGVVAAAATPLKRARPVEVSESATAAAAEPALPLLFTVDYDDGMPWTFSCVIAALSEDDARDMIADALQKRAYVSPQRASTVAAQCTLKRFDGTRRLMRLMQINALRNALRPPSDDEDGSNNNDVE
jgi:hypothetical protein